MAAPPPARIISIHNMASWMIDRFGNEGRQGTLPSRPRDDGEHRLLLPHRTRQRIRRGGPEELGRIGWRPLRVERHEAIHLRRRGERHLCHDGPHRRAQDARDHLPGGREGHAGRQLRRSREETGLECFSHGAGHLRGCEGAGGKPRGRRGRGFPYCDDGFGRRAAEYRRLLAGWSATLSR